MPRESERVELHYVSSVWHVAIVTMVTDLTITL